MWKRSLNQLVQEFKNGGNDVTNPRKRYVFAELVMLMVMVIMMVMTMVLMVAALMTLKSGGKPLDSCKKGGEA